MRTPTLASPVCPVLVDLAEGAPLWRLHSDCFAADVFNPTIPARFAGGRFDSADGSYSYLYAGGDTITCVAETLLRDRVSAAPYQIPRKRLENIRLSKLVLSRAAAVVKLHGNGLAALGLDAELTASGPQTYELTRQWAAAIRHWAPDACGLEWRARHDNDRLAYCFFGDCCSAGLFRIVQSYLVDGPGRGRALLRDAMARHNAVFE